MIDPSDLLITLHSIMDDELLTHEKGKFYIWRVSPQVFTLLKREVSKLTYNGDCHFVPFQHHFLLFNLPGAVDVNLHPGEVRLSDCGGGRRTFVKVK